MAVDDEFGWVGAVAVPVRGGKFFAMFTVQTKL